MDIDAIMSMDGRRVVEPPAVLSVKKSRASTVKWVISMFLDKGYSQHSSWGMFVPFILAYCEKHGIPYELTGRPGIGYYIRRTDKKL